MTNAMRRPCFEDQDLECQLSRYSEHSDPLCGWIERGGKWENCQSGKLNPAYPEWRRLYFTVPCDKCHGTGRVRRGR